MCLFLVMKSNVHMMMAPSLGRWQMCATNVVISKAINIFSISAQWKSKKRVEHKGKQVLWALLFPKMSPIITVGSCTVPKLYCTVPRIRLCTGLPCPGRGNQRSSSSAGKIVSLRRIHVGMRSGSGWEIRGRKGDKDRKTVERICLHVE